MSVEYARGRKVLTEGGFGGIVPDLATVDKANLRWEVPSFEVVSLDERDD